MLLLGWHRCSPEEVPALLLGLGSLPGFCPALAAQDRVPGGAAQLRVPAVAGGALRGSGQPWRGSSSPQCPFLPRARRGREAGTALAGPGAAGGRCQVTEGAVCDPAVPGRAGARSGIGCGTCSIPGCGQQCPGSGHRLPVGFVGYHHRNHGAHGAPLRCWQQVGSVSSPALSCASLSPPRRSQGEAQDEPTGGRV